MPNKMKESNCASLLRQLRRDFKRAIESEDPIQGSDAVDYICALYFDTEEALQRDGLKP
jgi:hypothetical protein